MPAVLLASAVHQTTSVDVQVTANALQTKYVIQTTSATALVCQSDKSVRHSMEIFLILAVLLVFAAAQTTFVAAQATITAHQVKHVIVITSAMFLICHMGKVA